MDLALEHAARSDTGAVRLNNEDAALASPRLQGAADDGFERE
jgi:hypothetical protein